MDKSVTLFFSSWLCVPMKWCPWNGMGCPSWFMSWARWIGFFKSRYIVIARDQQQQQRVVSCLRAGQPICTAEAAGNLLSFVRTRHIVAHKICSIRPGSNSFLVHNTYKTRFLISKLLYLLLKCRPVSSILSRSSCALVRNGQYGQLRKSHPQTDNRKTLLWKNTSSYNMSHI